MFNLVPIVNGMMNMLVAKFMLNDAPHAMLGLEDNPNRTKRKGLVDVYGSWSVGRAQSICPLHDWECIEREASRLAGMVRSKG